MSDISPIVATGTAAFGTPLLSDGSLTPVQDADRAGHRTATERLPYFAYEVPNRPEDEGFGA